MRFVRKWFRLLHRDIGYLLFALTAAYAVSGVAVNHIDDWNPNYDVSRSAFTLGPLQAEDLGTLERGIVQALEIDPTEVRGRFRPGPTEFVVFLPEGGEVRVDLTTGSGTIERYTPRPLLYSFNVLHLNRLKGAWTLVADVFAVLLRFLAVSGLFLLKGPPGLGGRGKWLVALGIVVPVVFLVTYMR